MSTSKTLFSWRKFLRDNTELRRSVTQRTSVFGKTVTHPFPCRLGEEAISLDVTDPRTLTVVGFNCWALGMLTIFRPCFIILISIIPRVKNTTRSIELFKMIALPICYSWLAFVLFVLFILGLIPIVSAKVKKRWILLVHPWMMLFLYLDVLVWLSLTTCLYIQLEMISPAGKDAVRQVTFTSLFILVVYFDILIYFLVYYIYITFYIVAEITIIEKFY